MPIQPVSQAKLKSLWDAIRTTPDDTAPGADPTAPPPPPVTPPAQADLRSAVAAAPSPGGDSSRVTPAPRVAPPPPAPPPTPPAAGGDPEAAAISALPNSPAAIPMAGGAPPDVSSPVLPSVKMAQPQMADMPASHSVDDLQNRVNARPTILNRVLTAGIPLAAAGIAAATHSPSGAIGVLQAQENQQAQRNLEHKSLQDQLAAARQEQEKEFDTAQRVTEQANAASEANRTRDIISRTLAGSRENVATTQAGARVTAAGLGADARKSAAEQAADARLQSAMYTADSNLEGRKYAADKGLEGHKYAADAALGRQQRSFDHADNKPTADEDRRADLGEAMKGYASALKEIAQRRPELFGKLQGRMTEARAHVGSDDPDIMAIGRLQDAIGTVIMGAHSMRNANHIAVAGNAISNIHNGADAIVKNIDDAMAGMDTFQTIHRPTLSGRVGGTSPAPKTGSPTPKPNAPVQAPKVEQWGKDPNTGKPVRLN